MGGVFARVEVNSTLLDHINAKEFEDKQLNALQNKVVRADAVVTTFNVSWVLWFIGRLCIPQVGY